MRTIRIYCSICKLKLTENLLEVAVNTLKLYDNTDAIEKNKFSIGTVYEKKEVLVALGDYYLKNHKQVSRLQGCCGSSGLDGMNKTCENGHEVATEVSDCWTPHYIGFNLGKIIIKEVSDPYNIKIIEV